VINATEPITPDTQATAIEEEPQGHVAEGTQIPTPDDVPRGTRGSLLEGVVVLDLTRFLAGPFGGMVLADLGATVIKVEQLVGDSTRNQHPYFLGEDSAYFLAINRNKQSIALDLRSPEGSEVLRKLIKDADVIIDNLRAPQRKARGLDFESLEKINPRIISCSVTGFGSDGPYADRPAYDIIVEALAGVMSLTGPEGGPSVRAGVPIGDITAGLYAAIGTLAGLAYRDRTGHGQHVDVSMLDSQISLLSYLAEYYFVGGLVAEHQGRAHVSIPTYNTFATKDGREIVTAANTQGMWKSLCEVLGRPELADDPRFSANKDRLAHRDELLDILRAECLTWDADELFNALVAKGVPAAPINPIDVALADPQVRHREMVVSAPHRDGGEYVTVGNPVKTDGPAGPDFTAPPALGGDSRRILTELGYSAEQIAEMVAAGAVKVSEA
jgi:CoA:oxalate CoA-transferase